MVDEKKIEEVIKRLDMWRYLEVGETIREGDVVCASEYSLAPEPDWEIGIGGGGWERCTGHLPIKRRK